MIFALIRSLLFAGVTCWANPDGTWTCGGDGDAPVFPPGSGVVTTNGMGICTNCVQMTQEQCDDNKRVLVTRLYVLEDELVRSKSQIEESRYDLLQLKDEGDQFVIQDYGLLPSGTGTSNPRYQAAIATEQYKYVLNYTGEGKPGSTSAWFTCNPVNSIANYYQQAVKPVIESSLRSLSNIDQSLDSCISQSSSLGDFVRSIPCEQCSFSLEDSGGGSGGGGGSGSGGGGSGESSCGPCLEQLRALNETVTSIDYRVKNLGLVASNVSTNVTDLLNLFRSYSRSVTNSLWRIDSFLHDDLDKYAKDLVSSVLVISNNVDGLQRDYYQAMKYAAEFKNADGTNEFDPVEISTNFLEAAYYKDLPWASRVEALLLSIAKPFSSDSSFDSPDTAEGEEGVRKVGESLDGAISDIGKTGQDSQTVISAARSAIESVSAVFTSSGGSAVPITLLEPDQWIGDDGLNITISPEVLDTSHTIFLLLWSCLALVVYVKLFVFSVTLAIKVWNWLYKRYTILFT